MSIRLVPLGPQHVDALDALVEDPAVLRFTRVPEPVPAGFGRRGSRSRTTTRARHGTREALELLTTWALHELGMLRLELLIGADNAGSQGVARRCGYTFEGTRRSAYMKPGRREDTQVWSLLPSDPRPAR